MGTCAFLLCSWVRPQAVAMFSCVECAQWVCTGLHVLNVTSGSALVCMWWHCRLLPQQVGMV
jgi:hypothetical protein